MRKPIAVACAFVCLMAGSISLRAAVRGSGAMYVGGTVSAIPEKTEGRLDTSQEALPSSSRRRVKF